MHMDTCASLYVYSCIFEYRREQLIWFTLWNNVYICMDCRNQLIKFIKQDSFLIELLTEILHSWAHLHAMDQRQINDDSWSLHSSVQPQTSVVLWLQFIFSDILLQISLKHKALSNSFSGYTWEWVLKVKHHIGDSPGKNTMNPLEVSSL